MQIQQILNNQIAVSVDIALAVDQSTHGEDRRYRHIDDEGNVGVISHSEIVNTISKALPKIAQLSVDGQIKGKASVVIYNKNNNLNVVGEVDLIQDAFKVITIMKKENFRPRPGDIRIEV